MATIHATTMTPSKLELLTAWLPRQAWYRGAGAPRLAKAGGFRLDDPAGAVGIEFLLLADEADGTCYHVPLAYRGQPLPGAGDALVGTAEHGVLGPRWVYDGARDPAVVAQLVALARGAAVAQHQSVSDTPDPSVSVEGTLGAGEGGTGDLHVEVLRVLAEPTAGDRPARPDAAGVPFGARFGAAAVVAELHAPGRPPRRRRVAMVTRTAP